jgi:predicted PurR-regulated permease PerM
MAEQSVDGKSEGRSEAQQAGVRKDMRKTYASLLVAALSAFIIYALIPYATAFFGAIILYTLFSPLYHWLMRRIGLSKSVAAVTVIVFSIFLILIPFLYVMGLLIDEVRVVVVEVGSLSPNLAELNSLVPGLDIAELVKGQITNLTQVVSDQMLSMILSFSQGVINITIMYFLLYYLFVNHPQLPKMAASISPFNEKNTARLAQEVVTVTHSTIISQGAVGVLHGVMLAVGFHLFGIPQAVFWGFMAVILSILPVFGTPLLWLPAGAYKLYSGDVTSGIGILVWGAILTNVDSILRPFIQLRVSNMHPLISVIGFFIGVSYFGLLGIIVGPLLLSYFFLTFEMFKEEYLQNPDTKG